MLRVGYIGLGKMGFQIAKIFLNTLKQLFGIEQLKSQ